jgi:hypothetical protein
MTATIAHVVLVVDEAVVVAVTEQRMWKRPRWGAPCAAAGEVILGPRGHYLSMPARYAPGRLVSDYLSSLLLTFYSSMTSATGHFGHALLRQEFRPD